MQDVISPSSLPHSAPQKIKIKRGYICGIPLDCLTQAEAVDIISGYIRLQRKARVFTPNAQHLVSAQLDSGFRQIYAKADISLVDGMPLVWLSGFFLGFRLPQRIAGIDLTRELCKRASKENFSLFFLGMKEEITQAAVSRLKQEYSGIRIFGHSSVLSPEDIFNEIKAARIINQINAVRPDLLFVAFGSPAQEKWIDRYFNRVDAKIFLGVGCTLDVISGRFRRSPAWMQRMGLEWFFRLKQEPRRLWKRYLTGNALFIYFTAKELLKKKISAFVDSLSGENVFRGKTINRYRFKAGCLKLNFIKAPASSLRRCFRAVKNKAAGLPLMLSVDISTACNADCFMCSLKSAPLKKTMEFATFKRLANVFSSLAYCHLSCSGEPLMHPRLLEMLDFVNEHSAGNCITGFNTNGLLLHEDLSCQLLKRNIGRIVVSVDSSNENLFKEIRGISLGRVLENISQLVSLKKKMRRSLTNIEAWIVASNKNLHDLKATLLLLHKLGISRVGINALEPYSESLADEAPYIENGRYALALKDCLEAARALRMDIIIPSPWPVMPSCGAKNSCVVTVDGDVAPCAGLVYPRRVFVEVNDGIIQKGNAMRPASSFGNINQEDFFSIWNSRAYSGFRNEINGLFAPECRGCLNKYGIICP